MRYFKLKEQNEDYSGITYLNVNIGILIGPEYRNDPQSCPDFKVIYKKANDKADVVEIEFFPSKNPGDNSNYNINCGFDNAKTGYDFASEIKADGYYVETESFGNE